jgi:hypothetical protein
MAIFDPPMRNKTTETVSLPFNGDALYWRIYIYSDDFLKTQTRVPLKYHDITARYFASLWKDCFQNKIHSNKRKYRFPIGYEIIPNNSLFDLNKYLDQEMRMFLYDQKIAEMNEKLAFVMQMGQIALQAKELILLSKSETMEFDISRNDNSDQIKIASSIIA